MEAYRRTVVETSAIVLARISKKCVLELQLLACNAWLQVDRLFLMNHWPVFRVRCASFTLLYGVAVDVILRPPLRSLPEPSSKETRWRTRRRAWSPAGPSSTCRRWSMLRYGVVHHPSSSFGCMSFLRMLLFSLCCFCSTTDCAAASLTLPTFIITQAACLRAARLGGNTVDEAAEIDMRLAAIAERYGRPSAAVQLYCRMMASPATNDNGR